MPTEVDRPRSSEKAQLAAFELYFGATVPEAAAQVGVSEDTVRNWLVSPWWPELAAAAEEHANDYLERQARRALRRRLEEGDAISARWLLERTDRRFAPPTKKVEIEGSVDHRHEAKQLERLPTAVIERLADADDDAIDAIFEEARPLALESEPTTH